MTTSSGGSAGCLVLLGHGPADQVRELLRQAGPPLAAALALPWADWLDPAEPESALARPRPGLVGLPVDPGQSLPHGGNWAEALAAHRQPVLVLLSAVQVAWGLGAASAALMAQQRVPLLGLGQWGGRWDGELRRREPLPWLGWLGEEAGMDAEPARHFALAVRFRQAALPQG